jgi:hypothetical protein
MTIEQQDVFLSVGEKLQTDPRTGKNRRKGLCRSWTSVARDVLREEFVRRGIIADVIFEASEVEIEPYLSHTFLRVGYKGVIWLFDGTGVGRFEPYIGPEEDAPEHLLNHHPDMINQYWD